MKRKIFIFIFLIILCIFTFAVGERESTDTGTSTTESTDTGTFTTEITIEDITGKGLEVTGVDIKTVEGNEGARWAICIGINDYEDSEILNLSKPRNDAKTLGAILESQGQFDNVYIMTDDINARDEDYPRLRHLLNRLDFLKNFIQPEDLVVFFFSGHGISDEDGKGYLVVSDSYTNNIFDTSLPVETVVNWLNELNVDRSLLLLDACREQITENKSAISRSLVQERYENAVIRAIFYATKSEGFSYEDPESDYSVFARFIIDGLEGYADIKYAGNGDDIVTFFELSAFVEEEVKAWALRNGKVQLPFTDIYGEKTGDLALTVVLYGEQEAISSGNISVITYPQGADVYIKGSYRGNSPCTVEGLEPGEYTVKVELSGYGDKIETVTVESGREITVNFSLTETYLISDDLILVEGGSFEMGRTSGRGDRYEKPVHSVTVSSFYMSKYEVTFEEYDEFCDDTGREYPDAEGWGRGSRPVINVEWYDAVKYCNWLSEKEGLTPCYSGSGENISCNFNANGYRLPTEAEWEYAAKGGNNHDGYEYSGSNTAGDVGWYSGNSGSETHPVGGKSPNSLGIYDMSGNVWEWCFDWYGSDYYSTTSLVDPEGPDSGSLRVLRGGSWNFNTFDLRCAFRNWGDPTKASNGLGFRVVVSSF